MANDQLTFVSSMLDYDLQIKLSDLKGLDEIDIRYLVSNYGKQIAELIKYGKTSYTVTEDDPIDYCSVCDGEVGLGGMYYGGFTMCAGCY